MNLTIVVPFRNGHRTLPRLLSSLPPDLPVIVVDDLSSPPLERSLTDERTKIMRRSERGYFSGACNTGIDACETDVLILNQDVWLQGRRWLEILQEKRETYAVIGDGVMNHPAWPEGYVQGTFMYLRRDAWDVLGGFNEIDYPLWGATAEWQLRACRRGFKALPMRCPWLKHERGRRPYGASIAATLEAQPEKRSWFIRTPPEISIVVACYNYGRYLEAAVQSALEQTFTSTEIIIVDDGSQDETPEVGRWLADPWKAIRYIRHRKNRGTPHAYNTGVKASFGSYITMLSADDMREPWSLRLMYDALRDHPKRFAYDDAIFLFEDGRRQRRTYPNYDFDRLIQKNYIHAGILYPRSAWVEVGGYPGNMIYGREDWAFNVALGVHGFCGIHVPEPGYIYRIEGQGRHHRNTNPKWASKFREQMYALFPEIYRGEKPMGCCGSRTTKTSKPVKGTRTLTTATLETTEVLVEYVGPNFGRESWFGLETGHRYEVSRSQPIIAVDKRDLEGLLSAKKGTSLVFRRVRARPNAGVTRQEAEEVNPPRPVEKTITAPVNPTEYTVSDFKEVIDSEAHGWTPAEIRLMLYIEQSGKDRVTLTRALEDLLDADD